MYYIILRYSLHFSSVAYKHLWNHCQTLLIRVISKYVRDTAPFKTLFGPLTSLYLAWIRKHTLFYFYIRAYHGMKLNKLIAAIKLFWSIFDVCVSILYFLHVLADGYSSNLYIFSFTYFLWLLDVFCNTLNFLNHRRKQLLA